MKPLQAFMRRFDWLLLVAALFALVTWAALNQ